MKSSTCAKHSTSTFQTTVIRGGTEGVNKSYSNGAGALSREGLVKDVQHVLHQRGIPVDSSTYVRLLRRCIDMKDVVVGQQIHAHILQTRFKSDTYILNTLLDMYTKCAHLEDARQLFNSMSRRDTFTWNMMLTGYSKHGHADEAFRIYEQMQQQGVAPERMTFTSVVNVCASLGSLGKAKRVHADILQTGITTDIILENALIYMYAKCGSIKHACEVFEKMQKRDVVSWTALIVGLVENGCGEKALEIFGQMQEGVKPDRITCLSILKACSSPAALNSGKHIHEHIVKAGFDSDVRVMNALFSMYARCGSLDEARQVFDNMDIKDVVSWNAMIVGYADHCQYAEAFDVYHQMLKEGKTPNDVTFLSILKACSSPMFLDLGKQVHTHVNKAGYTRDVRVGNALICMYAKCGSITSAREVFNKMATRDVISWTVIIRGYTEHGHYQEAFAVFNEMQEQQVKPDGITFMSILNACSSPADLNQGKQVHANVVEAGFGSDVNVVNALVGMYLRCGSLKDAQQLFDKMVTKNVISWNTMIGGYAELGNSDQSFQAFHKMKQEGIKADSVTFISILSAVHSPAAVEQGRQLHLLIAQSGFDSNVRVGNALINMYVKCGSIKEARQMFDNMVSRDAISWNTIIGGYAEHGPSEEAFRIFKQMKQENITVNSITYLSILNACSNKAALAQGKEVHTHIVKAGLESDVRVGNALVSMYARCGSMKDAQQVFDSMANRNVISWTAMIGGFSKDGDGEEAFSVFNQMQQEGIVPNTITFISILKLCASTAALLAGKRVHAIINQAGLQADICVGNALVDMYAKCGSIVDAQEVFDKMHERDVVSWNAMITGYAQHGLGEDALQLYDQMRQEGPSPDSTTFVGVLSACSHAGLVYEGLQLFNSMCHDYSIIPTVEHYGCMVDLLGRAGLLNAAEGFIRNMPFEADASIWAAFLGACRIHSNIKLADHAAKILLRTETQNAAVYVQLSNIYAAAGLWDDVEKVRNSMKDRGVKKEPGRTWIELGDQTHSFMTEDRSHPQSEKIYAELDRLGKLIQTAGYVPDTRFVVHDVDEKLKEISLCYHSEKLAIAFGIINMPSGTPIRIIKNLRVCTDCHTFTKFISKITGREIVARDSRRFHHFKNGLCSCGDFW